VWVGRGFFVDVVGGEEALDVVLADGGLLVLEVPEESPVADEVVCGCGESCFVLGGPGGVVVEGGGDGFGCGGVVEEDVGEGGGIGLYRWCCGWSRSVSMGWWLWHGWSIFLVDVILSLMLFCCVFYLKSKKCCILRQSF
jgi:hypothetical protein